MFEATELEAQVKRLLAEEPGRLAYYERPVAVCYYIHDCQRAIRALLALVQEHGPSNGQKCG